jgi:hypothetical protein
MVGFERMSQSVQFQAQTKERKQRATEQKPVTRHQKYIGIAIERWEMPEENHREQCPAEDEAEATKEQEQVTLNLTGTLKWDWNASQTIPIPNLHDEQNSDRRQIVVRNEWNLLARILQ